MSIEIESEDVIRLVLQFLKENEYEEAAKTLEQETNVKINTVESKDTFIKDIKEGNWDTVLLYVSDLKIPPQKLIDLYEQVVLELAEMRELGAARSLLRQTEPMFLLKQKQPERYLRLEHILSRSFFDSKEVYNGTTKEKKRNMIAQALSNDVPVVEPARLMTLLEDCVKWQQHQGLLPLDTEFDIFKSAEKVQEAEEDAFAQYPSVEIKLPGKNTYAECTTFSPNGLYLVSGSVDGFIEVWNYANGKLRKDLKYQAEENLMAMDQAILCLNFSNDSELLVSGSTDGKIAIWKLQTGYCSRRFSPAHSQGVTSVCFNKDSSEILSCSFDATIKIHNLKSGKLVKAFEGHTSFVNSAVYSRDNTQIISGSSDETVKIWDTTTGQCLYSISLDEGVKAQMILALREQQYIVIQSNHIACILNEKGKIMKKIEHGNKLISGALSPQGGLLYTLDEDSTMHCFDLYSGQFKGRVKICKEDVIGMSSHPFSNIVAVNNEKRRIYLYTSTLK